MSDSIAITSGKGGVGKTTIAVNLSIAYKQLMSDVLLLDTDLGMANSHVLLGVNPDKTLSDIVNGNCILNQVILKTQTGVELVSGGAASSDLLNLSNSQRYILLNEIESYLSKKSNSKLIVDIAAGAEDNSIVFANACNRIVVIIVGEPTSFIDSYALIKTVHNTSSFKNFSIVVNQVDNHVQSRELFKKFEKITTRFLDVKLHHVGFLEYSSKIKNSIIDRKPILLSEPKSDISMQFKKIATEIVKTPKNTWGGLSFFSRKKRA